MKDVILKKKKTCEKCPAQLPTAQTALLLHNCNSNDINHEYNFVKSQTENPNHIREAGTS